jgi:pimeloyl-ACP methyl ester carboxylesterase
MNNIIFSHGNGFPASTYRCFTNDLNRRGFQVASIEKFGHDARYPVTSNWPFLVQELADFAKVIHHESGEKPFLIGHSLGGLLSLMCASKHPHLTAFRLSSGGGLESQCASACQKNQLDWLCQPRQDQQITPSTLASY